MKNRKCYVVEGKSRKELNDFAQYFRKYLHVNSYFFPVVQTLEAIGCIVEGAHFEVLPDKDFPDGEHGYTDITTKTIYLRESVYDGACEGKGRDRMTVMHEIAHLLSFTVYNFKLARSFREDSIPAYMDPEWQAKCLAGAIMMDNELIRGMSAEDVALKCGVSLDAARYQLSKI